MKSQKTLMDCRRDARNVAKWDWQYSHCAPEAGNSEVGILYGVPVNTRASGESYKRKLRASRIRAKMRNPAMRKRHAAFNLQRLVKFPRRLRTKGAA